MTEFLATRFGKGSAELIKAAHVAAEQRPIETVWDVVTGATEYARGLSHQDDRIAIERIAGGLLSTVQRELVPIAA